MKEKKQVYNGYEEKYLTGSELNNLFNNKYLTSGRHHSAVLGLSIPDYLYFLGVDNQKEYRIFYNKNFCRLMKGDTDALIVFFGHTSLENVKISIDPNIVYAPKKCPICNNSMEFKQGKYGPFLGCKAYPKCKFTSKIPIIGNSQNPFIIAYLENTKSNPE